MESIPWVNARPEPEVRKRRNALLGHRHYEAVQKPPLDRILDLSIVVYFTRGKGLRAWFLTEGYR